MSVQKLTQISAEVLYQAITDTQNEGQNTAVVECRELGKWRSIILVFQSPYCDIIL